MPAEKAESSVRLSSPSPSLNEIRSRGHDGRRPRQRGRLRAEAGGEVSLTLASERSAQRVETLLSDFHTCVGFPRWPNAFYGTNESFCLFAFLISWRMHPSFLQQGHAFTSARSIFWSWVFWYVFWLVRDQLDSSFWGRPATLKRLHLKKTWRSDWLHLKQQPVRPVLAAAHVVCCSVAWTVL